MVTITQQPDRWNLANIPNVFVLDGLGSADQYVLQVTIDGQPVSTYIQAQNPEGVAMFDIQKVLQSYLRNVNTETTIGFAPTPGALVSYQVRYGSITDNIIGFDGTTATFFALNGYDSYDVINWDSTDYIPDPIAVECISELPPPVPVNAIYSRKYEWLTNWPTTQAGMKTFKVRRDEYRSLSFFNIVKDFDQGQMWGANESPFFVKINYYNSAGSLLESDIRTITSVLGLGNRTDCNDNTSALSDIEDYVGTMGVGPWNIEMGPFTWTYPNQTKSYTIQLYSKNVCFQPYTIDDCDDLASLEDYLGFVIYEARFEIEDACTPFEPINVSFMNQYGIRDYYTFDRRNEQRTNTTRNNYTKVLGSWSDTSFTISNTDRGNIVFSSDISTAMQLSTYWMSDEESKWMEELFTSPSVAIFQDGKWTPVVITSAEYQQKTFSRDRMFQHFITVEFANKKKVQRG